MGTINTTDVIYATLMQRGRQIATFKFSGLASFSDIISHVRRATSGRIGLVTLHMRNRSQGWSQNRSFIMSPTPSVPVQLSLF